MDENKYFEKIAEYKLLAKHEVGQNFLIDIDAAKRIVELAEISPEDKVLEIGSGAGSLSFFIEKAKAETTLIDIDEGLVQKLVEDFDGLEHMKPIVGNAARFDYAPYTKIISNLPYYITSSILERVLLNAKNLQTGVFMVQKEVISRLRASAGSEEYGPLSILIAYRCDFIKGFNVPKTSFVPAPHIESSVFVLKAKESSSLETANKLYEVVSALFLHKRKTILNNLSVYLNDPAKAKNVLDKTNIPANKRPQELNLNSYLTLLEAID